MTKTINQVLKLAAKKLAQDRTPNPRLEAEILLSFLLGKSREYLLAHPEKILRPGLVKKYEELIKKRCTGKPVAQIVGHKEFFGLDFIVDENVLTPRPETEILVEETLDLVRSMVRTKVHTCVDTSVPTKNILCIDVGTGSGCIIVSIAKNLLNQASSLDLARDNTAIQFLGLDISEQALEVARQNARLHDLDKKISFEKNNLLENLGRTLSFPITNYQLLITANLPYLPSVWKNNLGTPETVGLKYEPAIALEGGPDGLDLYRKLAEQIKELHKINKNITLLCEIDPSQSEEMKKIFSFMDSNKIVKDLAGLDRVFIARYK